MGFAGDDDFPRQWAPTLRDRAARAARVRGLLLGGSLDDGTPWPLSDIDILPIYEAALAERVALLARWGREGWYTPLGARRRHTHSWRARRWIGEDVTEIQDARDVLRVCSHYELRKVAAAPFPAWLVDEAA
jgi:hypothetical protein